MRYQILFLIYSTHSLLFAQTDPNSGMFWNNFAHYNPATSGMKLGHEAYLTYRNQWVGLSNSQETIFFNYNTVLLDKHGIGLNYWHSKAGFSTDQNVKLNYNYQLNRDCRPGMMRKFSIGAAVGYLKSRINYSWFSPTVDMDPALYSNNIDRLTFSTGFAYLSAFERIYTGIGISNVSPGYYKNNFTYGTHVYLNFRYTYRISRTMKLIGETLAFTNLNFYVQDFNARASYRNKLEFGLSYRTTNFAGINASWLIKRRFKIGYALELSNSKLNSTIAAFSHEVVLGYNSLW